MTAAEQKTIFVFLDESGNFDFSPKGTKFFVLTGFATFDPVTKRQDLIKLRYELLSSGTDQECFHATEDTQEVRNQVFELFTELAGTFEVHSVIAQKNKANPSLYKESYLKKGRLIERVTGFGLYKKCCECLLKYLFAGKSGKVDKIVVVLGSLYTGDKKKLVLQTLKKFLKETFPSVPFEIYSHASHADLNCQLADYCCWAISIRQERSETRPYETIKSQIKNHFEIFKSGTTEFYQYADKK
jgi:hypothetical protein